MAHRIGQFLFTALVLFGLWLLFTGTLDPQETAVGALLAAGIALFTHRRFTRGGLQNLAPGRLLCLLAYLPFFTWQMIKANLDVAYRALHPRMPLNPGIVRVKTRMTSDIGKMAVANSITLTPGTLTLEVDDDTLYIHWIDVRSTDPEEARRLIPGVFEPCLKRIFP